MYQQEKARGIDYRSLGTKKILLAEDVEFNQYIARQMLESWGFEVSLANNGIEVLDLLAHRDFDCILMDIQMPEMDGIQAARRIRQFSDPAKAGIPIIALTANALRGDGEKYKAAGMTDYLPKPIEESKLFHIISKNLLAKRSCDVSPTENKSTTEEKNIQPVQPERLYDLTMVRSVSGGDESFIKKMVDLFIETVPPNVSDLMKASEKSEWEQVARLAHKLKSTVDSMGIKALKTDIRTVEANAKQKIGLDEIAPLTNTIERVISQCIVQLREDFK